MKKGFLLILSLLFLGSQMNAQHFIEHGSMYPETWLFVFPKNIEGFRGMQTEYWNSDSSKWKIGGRWTHSGGNSAEPAKLIIEYIDSGQWHTSDSFFYTFESGRMKQMTTGLIPDGFLQKYTYGINGRLEKVLSQQTDSLIWVNQELDSNIYNAAGRMILTYKQKWVNQWENDYQDTFSYNNTGKLSFKETRMWFFNEYVPYRRYHYSYDAANNMIGIRFEDISNWHMVDTTKRTTMTYDAQGRMTQLLTQSYSSGIWNNSSRVRFSLNANGKVIQELYEIVDTAGNWKNMERTTYTYLPTSTDEVILDKAFFEVSPNPVQNGRLHVQAKDKTTLMRNIELYDINGRLVMKQNIDNQWVANIETAGLMNGLHVLKIKTDNGVSIQKVMIQQ